LGSATPQTNQGFYTGVNASQTPSGSDNLISKTNGTFTYYGTKKTAVPNGVFTFPSSDGINTIICYSNYSDASNSSINNNLVTGDKLAATAVGYLNSSGLPNTLLGFCFGGNNPSLSGWCQGTATYTSGGRTLTPGIYSLYQSFTLGDFSYYEYDNNGNRGSLITGTGKVQGQVTYSSMKCLAFDIEYGVPGKTSSSAYDFINFFKYIKESPNTVYGTNLRPLIIISFAHSGSNTFTNSIDVNVIQRLLSGAAAGTDTGLLEGECIYNYISPRLYTCNIGTTNEYCASPQIAWSDAWAPIPTTTPNVRSLLSTNNTFKSNGLGMILPSINYYNLYNGPGTNTGANPNLYWFQNNIAKTTGTNPQDSTVAGGTAPTDTLSAPGTITYGIDAGAYTFFQTMFGVTGTTYTLGGWCEWVNGTTI